MVERESESDQERDTAATPTVPGGRGHTRRHRLLSALFVWRIRRRPGLWGGALLAISVVAVLSVGVSGAFAGTNGLFHAPSGTSGAYRRPFPTPTPTPPPSPNALFNQRQGCATGTPKPISDMIHGELQRLQGQTLPTASTRGRLCLCGNTGARTAGRCLAGTERVEACSRADGHVLAFAKGIPQCERSISWSSDAGPRLRSEIAMAKRTAADFTQREYGQLAELARGVYWAPSRFHGALDVIKQKYPTLEVTEQEQLARPVRAVARSTR